MTNITSQMVGDWYCTSEQRSFTVSFVPLICLRSFLFFSYADTSRGEPMCVAAICCFGLEFWSANVQHRGTRSTMKFEPTLWIEMVNGSEQQHICLVISPNVLINTLDVVLWPANLFQDSRDSTVGAAQHSHPRGGPSL